MVGPDDVTETTEPWQLTQNVETPAGALRNLKQVLSLRPDPDRKEAIRIAARELLGHLERLGVDGAPYLRYGMAGLSVSSVLGSVLASLSDPDVDVDRGIDVDGWRTALAIPTAGGIHAGVSSALPRLHAWAVNAPLDDLLLLNPPSRSDLPMPIGFDASERDLQLQYRWMVDRTLNVPLDVWNRSELHLEYRWRDGTLPAIAPSSLMNAATVDPVELIAKIAHDAVYSRVDQEEEQLNKIRAGMQDQAKSFLRQNRFAEAGALFEYLLSRNPTDASATNNLGFCVAPIDQARAIELFRSAKSLGYRHPSLLLYNRLCVESQRADFGELLLEVEHYWASRLEKFPKPSTIWVPPGPEGGNFKLVETSDVRVDLARRMISACQELGRFDRLPKWRERLAELSDGANRPDGA